MLLTVSDQRRLRRGEPEVGREYRCARLRSCSRIAARPRARRSLRAPLLRFTDESAYAVRVEIMREGFARVRPREDTAQIPVGSHKVDHAVFQ
jgi:hypothetical protein